MDNASIVASASATALCTAVTGSASSLIRQTVITPEGITISRPALDPPGFDRDGLRTGPTYRDGCPHCNSGLGADHKLRCPMWRVRPRPLVPWQGVRLA